MNDETPKKGSFEEIAVDRNTFDAIARFKRSKGTSSISFNGLNDGYVEEFSVFRFNDEGGRNNLFLYTTHHGYDEIIALDVFETGNHAPYKVCIKTGSSYNLTINPVDDLEKFQISSSIQHILACMSLLSIKMKDDKEHCEMLELAFDYMKVLDEEYKYT